MRHSLLLSALVATAISGITPAFAADEDVPPEFRASTFEIYAGVFGAANTINSQINDDTGALINDLDGTGFAYGIRGGVDYVMDGWVVGAVGDWTFGGDLAEDTLNANDTGLPNLGTLRGRAGVMLGNSLFYVTGGLAYAEIEFNTDDVAPLIGNRDYQSTSWTLGGGIDVGITDSLSLGVEYLYVDVKEKSYTFGTGPTPAPETIEQEVDAIHTIRVGMNYAFSI